MANCLSEIFKINEVGFVDIVDRVKNAESFRAVQLQAMP